MRKRRRTASDRLSANPTRGAFFHTRPCHVDGFCGKHKGEPAEGLLSYQRAQLSTLAPASD